MCYCFPIFQRTFCYSLRSPSVFVGSAKVEAIFDLTKKTFRTFFLSRLFGRSLFLRSAPSVCSVWESKIAVFYLNGQILVEININDIIHHPNYQ
jgi:hypothetical protein